MVRAGVKFEREHRRDHVVKLALSGASCRDIAATLGISPMTASRDLRARLQEAAAADRRTTERYRTVQIARCERLLAAVWDKAIDGDPPSVNTALKCIERICSLVGCDAPPVDGGIPAQPPKVTYVSPPPSEPPVFTAEAHTIPPPPAVDVDDDAEDEAVVVDWLAARIRDLMRPESAP